MQRISIYKEALILRILDLDRLFRAIARSHQDGKFKKLSEGDYYHKTYELNQYLDYFDKEDETLSTDFLRELFNTSKEN